MASAPGRACGCSIMAATAGASSPKTANVGFGLQGESCRQRVNVVVAGVVSAAVSVCVSLSLQGCAVAAAAAATNGSSSSTDWFPWEHVTPEQEVPKQGTCSTCIGVVDDTLGSCNATTNCVSSFDDRLVLSPPSPAA